MKEALLIIDVQNDYFPGGANELFRAAEAEERIKKLIAESRDCGRQIIYMQHFNEPGDSFFIEGTPGADISERIAPREEDQIFVKRYPNSFLKTGLHDYLQANGIEKLIVCGMMTHMCVDTTVRAAMDYGYQVSLAADACATKDLCRNGQVIPAEVVQNVFIASLQGTFCEVI